MRFDSSDARHHKPKHRFKDFFKNKDNFCSSKKSYHLWHAKWSVPYSKSDCCLTPNEQVFSYIMARTSYITNVLRVIQDKLDFYSVRSLKQQLAGKHVAPLEHIILIPRKPVLAFSPLCCVYSRVAPNTNVIIFSLTQPGFELTIYRTRGKVRD